MSAKTENKYIPSLFSCIGSRPRAKGLGNFGKKTKADLIHSVNEIHTRKTTFKY